MHPKDSNQNDNGIKGTAYEDNLEILDMFRLREEQVGRTP